MTFLICVRYPYAQFALSNELEYHISCVSLAVKRIFSLWKRPHSIILPFLNGWKRLAECIITVSSWKAIVESRGPCRALPHICLWVVLKLTMTTTFAARKPILRTTRNLLVYNSTRPLLCIAARNFLQQNHHECATKARPSQPDLEVQNTLWSWARQLASVAFKTPQSIQQYPKTRSH